jgi:hypothetical protein
MQNSYGQSFWFSFENSEYDLSSAPHDVVHPELDKCSKTQKSSPQAAWIGSQMRASRRVTSDQLPATFMRLMRMEPTVLAP